MIAVIYFVADTVKVKPSGRNIFNSVFKFGVVFNDSMRATED